MNAEQVGVLTSESSLELSASGSVASVDKCFKFYASRILRQIKFTDTDVRCRGNRLVSPYLTVMLPSFIILVINRVQYSHA